MHCNSTLQGPLAGQDCSKQRQEQHCTCTGQAAASPSAQIVCPSICLVISHSL
jgi:hypothetical protein